MGMIDLEPITIHGLSELVRKREISPVEIIKATLQRIEKYDGELKAFITVLSDEALECAKKAEASIVRGGYIGPLHGIPIGLKDIIYTKGVRTTCGSKILADFFPREDATVVTRLQQAGAIIIGKLNCHEFAYGGTSVNPHYGTPRNPWNAQCIPGGSSGGSAVAVATSLCLGALGTDTGGSIRIPSSLCGIVGLKPTYGRVSTYGVYPLSWSLDHVGPMTKTVRDTAILLQSLAGSDPRDANSSSHPVPDYSSIREDVRGLRAGVPSDFYFDNCDPEVRDRVLGALDILKDVGILIEEVSIPHLKHATTAGLVVLMAEAASQHENYLKGSQSEDYGKDVRGRLKTGIFVTAAQYIKAQMVRSVIRKEFLKAFELVDVLITPGLPLVAPTMEQDSVTLSGRKETVRSALTRLMRPYNLTGIPAIALPCGFSKSGLPIALQIAGRPFEESTIVAVAQAYEKNTPWHKRRPSIEAPEGSAYPSR
jgi:aspartyl-tRNA(Asn)/glutamyl-tRNA(Gln) amidotransferase subunit A